MRLRTMVRVATLSGALLLSTSCAGGSDPALTDSTSSLGSDDDDSSDDDVTSAGSSISASASLSGTGPTMSTSSSSSSSSGSTGVMETGSGEVTAAESSSGGPDPSTTTGEDGTTTTGAPGEVDLSSWSVVQTDSARVFALPAGTIVPVGGVVLIGRDATRADFETYWGVMLGPEVVYINALNEFPTLNGAETFELRDEMDASVDGPSPALTAGEALDRVDPEDDSATGWVVTSAAVGTPSPGTSTEPPAGFTGAFVSEVSDAIGIGSFVYEFVELRAF